MGRFSPWRWVRRWMGLHSPRELARAEILLDSIRAIRGEYARAQDAELTRAAVELRRSAAGAPLDEKGTSRAMALACEIASRRLGLSPFDVQILGALVLLRGNVAEMKTGEGKTLVAALAASVAALEGKGIHVVTVNDYLATRDAQWMGPLYEGMGLTVGVVTEDLDPESLRDLRRGAYAADVTYVTNHELVFDYLRDNLADSPDGVVGKPLSFALVDEVDFLLLDEARTPLIISGDSGENLELCREADAIVSRMEENRHFQVEHKIRQAVFLDEGYDLIETRLGIGSLADAANAQWRHALHNALLAHAVYQRDVDYIVEEGEVIIVDEFTGRVSPDKRYADGLHQALEAKEGLDVQPEDMTLAKISYQNYFRLYPRLAGMTGTAWSDKEELAKIYGLGVVRVPTHRPVARRDEPTVIYRSRDEKFDAVVAQVETWRGQSRPVLIGSVAVKDTEELSKRLQRRKIPHQVLNAKNHAQEAAIVAQAGRAGAVTVSTNMAGRGTDIILGGNPPDPRERETVVGAGGLAVIGTELHESPRIDDQLRGRAGRQGDPGSSVFFISLDDPIFKKFGKTVIPAWRERLASHPSGSPVEQGALRRALNELRKKVEVENKAIRRDVFRYDFVIEEQRRHVFEWRRRLLDPGAYGIEALREDFGAAVRDSDHAEAFEKAKAALGERFVEEAARSLRQALDTIWTEHLNALEALDEGIGLRGYAERDPLVEYKTEAAAMFGTLPDLVRRAALERLLQLAATSSAPPPGRPVPEGTTTSNRRKKRQRKG